MPKILIKGGTLVDEGSRRRADITIKDELILSVEIDVDDFNGFDLVIDAENHLVLPGIIDDQVHFRQPGLELKGTIASESRAAVAGGVTSFMEMPNTIPPTVNIEEWNRKNDFAANDAWCNYSFYLGATNDNLDEILKADPKSTCGIKVFMGSSTGNLLVDDDKALRNIFRKSQIPVAVHSEDEETINKNIEILRKKYGTSAKPAIHPEIRSREACVRCTERALNYSAETGGHLHLLHISTADEVVMIRNAKRSGLNVTAEVCVHHLLFTDQDYERKGNLIKWNPAIKSRSDRDALVEGLLDGTIDIVATDHAPHELDKKLDNYFNAPSGGPMVEHSLVVMLELVKKNLFSLEQVVKWMCHNPARLFRIDRRGFVQNGYFADLVIVRQNAPWQLRGKEANYLVRWSPLEGEHFTNKVVTTIVNGKVVYDNGVFKEENRHPMQMKFLR